MRSISHVKKTALNRNGDVLERDAALQISNVPLYLLQPVAILELGNSLEKLLGSFGIKVLADFRLLKAQELAETSNVKREDAREIIAAAHKHGAWFFDDYPIPDFVKGMVTKFSAAYKPQPVKTETAAVSFGTPTASNQPTSYEEPTASMPQPSLIPEGVTDESAAATTEHPLVEDEPEPTEQPVSATTPEPVPVPEAEAAAPAQPQPPSSPSEPQKKTVMKKTLASLPRRRELVKRTATLTAFWEESRIERPWYFDVPIAECDIDATVKESLALVKIKTIGDLALYHWSDIPPKKYMRPWKWKDAPGHLAFKGALFFGDLSEMKLAKASIDDGFKYWNARPDIVAKYGTKDTAPPQEDVVAKPVDNETMKRYRLKFGEMLASKVGKDVITMSFADFPAHIGMKPEDSALYRFAKNQGDIVFVGQMAEKSEAELRNRKASDAVINNINSELKTVKLRLGMLDEAKKLVDAEDVKIQQQAVQKAAYLAGLGLQ